MRYKRIKLSALFMLSLGLTGLQAQEAIPATGGNASGSGGSVSYTIGQVVYTTTSGTSGSIAQGVQQPFEISVVTGIHEASGINLTCTVYPNPTSDPLILKVENIDKQNLSYQLIDINGKLLENKKITSDETGIKMNSLTPSTYFVKVSNGNKEVKTFKIIKN